MSHPLDVYLAKIGANAADGAKMRAKYDERFPAPAAPAPAVPAIPIGLSDGPWWGDARMTKEDAEKLVAASGVDRAALGSLNVTPNALVARAALRLGEAAATALYRAFDNGFGRRAVDALSPPVQGPPPAPRGDDWSLDAIRARAARRTAGLDEESKPAAPQVERGIVGGAMHAADVTPADVAPRRGKGPRFEGRPFKDPQNYLEIRANAIAYEQWRREQDKSTSEARRYDSSQGAPQDPSTKGADGPCPRSSAPSARE